MSPILVPEHRGRPDEREVQGSNPNERRHSDGEGDPEGDDGDEDQHDECQGEVAMRRDVCVEVEK